MAAYRFCVAESYPGNTPNSVRHSCSARRTAVYTRGPARQAGKSPAFAKSNLTAEVTGTIARAVAASPGTSAPLDARS